MIVSSLKTQRFLQVSNYEYAKLVVLRFKSYPFMVQNNNFYTMKR